jgi:enoyl-CoA hydratase
VPKITYDVRDRVALVTLSRPEKRNAIDAEMAMELEACIDRYEADDQVRVAVLAAEMAEGRPVFCSGHDLRHFQETFGSVEENAVETERGGFAGLTRRARTKPLIAAVDGLATAGGCEMALACDLVVASERAAFCIAEAKWNLVASGGGGFRLPRLVGPKVAMDMMLTAEPINGRRAYELGLVSRLVPAGEVTEAALAVAAQICANGPLSVLVSKQLVDATTWSRSEEEAWQLLDRAAAQVRASDDLVEGLAAFVEKRPPRWATA